VSAQTPGLTLDQAFDMAVAADPEASRLVRQPPAAPEDGARGIPADLTARVTALFAEVRRAFTELTHARAGAALYETLSPMLLDMGETGSGPDPLGEMNRHDPRTAAGMARVALTRVTWRERVALAEIRLNAALGRTSQTPPVPALAPRAFAPVAPDLSRIDDAPSRRMVQEWAVRATAARERRQLASSTLVPQAQYVYEAAQLAYAGGRATLVDVVDSFRVLLEARMEEAAARADLDRALVELEIASGEAPERIAAAVRAAGHP
jgi:hypothetical protein